MTGDNVDGVDTGLIAAFVEYSNAEGITRYITQAGPIDRMPRLDGTWIYSS
ncbi:hypothetical protein [Paenibacillus polymyxa]|uniref:hypothetical protein n=1 Tax=Paenibacillus polymyxa TaxID=1406 RepID=UPI0002FAD797|nr:hypothetical protein [Paenibacillus polymyxa]